MKCAAYDIGGANIKRLVAETKKDGLKVVSNDISYFPFWKRKADFKVFLQKLRVNADAVAVTMTAELCDCFASKGEGVEYVTSICDSVLEKPFYLTVNGSLSRSADIDEPLSIAAANFVASLAYLEGNFGRGVLVDMGSTTTDIVPFERGKKMYGKGDLERLATKQLVYTGFLRTPVCAFVREVPYKGRMLGVASEVFAISADVYNILGPCDYTCETPDGRGKSVADSMRRLARQMCADIDEVGDEELRKICAYIVDAQVKLISSALREAAARWRMDTAYVCGVGKGVALKACIEAGLRAVDLSDTTPAHDNLPCLGLAWMLKEMRG